MPELTDEQIKVLLDEVIKNSIPLSLNVSEEDEKKLSEVVDCMTHLF